MAFHKSNGILKISCLIVCEGNLLLCCTFYGFRQSSDRVLCSNPKMNGSPFLKDFLGCDLHE